MSIDRKERCVLDTLADGRWWFGLDVVASSKGLLKRGTVYVTLGKMEDKGLIEGRKEEQLTPGLIPRRMYRILGKAPALVEAK